MQPVNRTIATGERKETGLLASEQTHELNEKKIRYLSKILKCTNVQILNLNEENNISFLKQNCTLIYTYIYIYIPFKVPLKVKRIRKISNLFFADRCKFKNPGNDVSSGYKAKETLDYYYYTL